MPFLVFQSLGPVELLILFAAFLVFWPEWRICQKVGWSGWLVLLLIVPLAGFVFLLALTLEALPRAGLSRWLVVLILFPVLNLLLLLWLAFQPWPAEAATRGY
ncbi:MAG: hypothetical protein Q8Q00_08300 [Dehalococcoidia bacterium]|nr:hypothetical protein [Dehalococcoidia bacterium]